jgi:hypothetical protein
MSKEGHWQMNILMLQCSIRHCTWRPTYLFCSCQPKCAIRALLCNIQFCYSWQWHVAQQYTQNALLCFHCNIHFVNAPQFFVIHTLPIIFQTWLQRSATSSSLWLLQHLSIFPMSLNNHNWFSVVPHTSWNLPHSCYVIPFWNSWSVR